MACSNPTPQGLHPLSANPIIIPVRGVAVEGDVKSPEESGSIVDAYKQLWQVVKLPAVKRFALVLVTFRYLLYHSWLGMRSDSTSSTMHTRYLRFQNVHSNASSLSE